MALVNNNAEFENIADTLIWLILIDLTQRP